MASRRVTAAVAELGIDQPRLQPHPFGRLMFRSPARVRARVLRCARLRRPSRHARARSPPPASRGQPRSAAASAAWMLPAIRYACDSARLSFCSSQAGTDQPDRALAMNCAATSARPSARAARAAARQATAPISLSGLAPRAASTCLSRLCVSRISLRSRCTQASATGAAGLGCWAGDRCRPSVRATVAWAASFAARRSRPRKASTSARYPRHWARSCSAPGVGCGAPPPNQGHGLPRRDGPTTARPLRGWQARAPGFPDAGRACSPGTLLTRISARAAAAAAAGWSPARAKW